PLMDGMTLLRSVLDKMPTLPVVMLTAHGTVPLAVEAMRAGASDFLLKPFDRDELLFVLKKALGRKDAPEEPPSTHFAMARLLEVATRAAQTDATVLIRGESGSGKGELARRIHQMSRRKNGPLIQVHCGALPDNLLESELFGYEKGAFTGANTRKP